MPTPRQAIQKAEGFKTLPEGWYFGQAGPLPDVRVRQAQVFLILGEMFGLRRANAFPGASGQIEVTFYDKNRVLEITVEANDSITIAEDLGDEQVYLRESRSRQDAYEKIREFSQSIWHSSDLFIASITIPKRAVFQAWPSTSMEESLSRSLIANAPGQKAARIVLTSPDTTQVRRETQRFTGPSQTQPYQTAITSFPNARPAEMNVIGTYITGQETELAVPLRK